MADINKRLLTAQGDIPAPQHKVKGNSDFEFTEGSGGAQHTKIVDSSGQPISIDEELKSIKRTQAQILDRLDNGIDTRLTGSIEEQVVLDNEVISPGSYVSFGNSSLSRSNCDEIWLSISNNKGDIWFMFRTFLGSSLSYECFYPSHRITEVNTTGNPTSILFTANRIYRGMDTYDLKQAKESIISYNYNIVGRVYNDNEEESTVTVIAHKIWRR